MHSSRLELPLQHSWPRLGAAVRGGLRLPLLPRLRVQQNSLLLLLGIGALIAIGWFSVEPGQRSIGEDELLAVLPQTPTLEPAAIAASRPAAPAPPQVTAEPSLPAAMTFQPDRFHLERNPSDHLPIDPATPTRLRVVTVRARVTAYTPYDHRQTHPEWADGVVAWHPYGRKRRVENHRYNLATDWAQFPPGATFIHVPGYMAETFSGFPERFRVVDDACGAARKARRRGSQPVIDVRFMHRRSVLGHQDSWGTRQLDVEVVFPQGFEIPASLRRWVVADEWRTYHQGQRIE